MDFKEQSQEWKIQSTNFKRSDIQFWNSESVFEFQRFQTSDFRLQRSDFKEWISKIKFQRSKRLEKRTFGARTMVKHTEDRNTNTFKIEPQKIEYLKKELQTSEHEPRKLDLEDRTLKIKLWKLDFSDWAFRPKFQNLILLLLNRELRSWLSRLEMSVKGKGKSVIGFSPLAVGRW